MEAHQKQITVYSNHTESAPVIYLPVVVGDGSEVYKCCRELDCPPFALVTIGGLDWNRELSTWRGIAGYSLAGLFALWSLWQTDAFDRAASASGSLWFPDFVDRASTAPFAGSPQAVYLSLGKKETKTPNRMMRHVLDDTRAMEALLVERGIPTTLELNPGNHFAQTDLRMARGIHWILTH